MHAKSANADLFGSIKPEELHHQDRSVRESRGHTELDDDPRRAPSHIDRNGEEELNRDLQLHKPRCCEPQRDLGDVQRVH